jgi:hypothetical protein
MDRYLNKRRYRPLITGLLCYRNLMAEEELDTLGLGEKGEYIRVAPVVGEKERYGFTAGELLLWFDICLLPLIIYKLQERQLTPLPRENSMLSIHVNLYFDRVISNVMSLLLVVITQQRYLLEALRVYTMRASS